jgi:GTP-binding protein
MLRDCGSVGRTTRMKIVSANFLQAAEEQKDYPTGGLTEIAFAGRSNVGKSSMINTLLGRRNLVRTSKTPGHTRKLNFYLINERFIFVDLPGYGYAAVPLEIRAKWGPMVETYLNNRTELSGVVLIVDARRPPTEADMLLLDYLRRTEKPLVIVATKGDKIGRSETVSLKKLIPSMAGPEVPVVMFSAHTGMGKNELWKEIKSLIE